MYTISKTSTAKNEIINVLKNKGTAMRAVQIENEIRQSQKNLSLTKGNFAGAFQQLRQDPGRYCLKLNKEEGTPLWMYDPSIEKKNTGIKGIINEKLNTLIKELNELKSEVSESEDFESIQKTIDVIESRLTEI